MLKSFVVTMLYGIVVSFMVFFIIYMFVAFCENYPNTARAIVIAIFGPFSVYMIGLLVQQVFDDEDPWH